MRRSLLTHTAVVFLILVVTGFVIYSNTIHAVFHFDDMSSILTQPRITSLSTFSHLGYWLNINNRPFAELTFALNYHFGQLDSHGYHIVNIIIHILNGFLVFLLMVKLLSFNNFIDERLAGHKRVMALFIALIFLVHPIQTEAVSYVVQRMRSLSVLFYIAGMYLYVLGRLAYLQKHKRVKSILLLMAAFFSGVIGVMTKQSAITFPAAFIFVELFFIRDMNGRICRKYLIVFASVVVLLAVGIVALGYLPAETVAISRKDYLLTQFRVIVKYIQLSFLPIHQNLDYDFSISTSLWNFFVLGSLAIILALLVVSGLLYRKKRMISFAIILFFLTMAVTSSIIPIRDVIFEHRLYLPILGYSIVVVYTLAFWLIEKHRQLLWIILTVITLAYTGATYLRNEVWKSEYALWHDVVKKSPAKPRPWSNLGFVMLDMDSLDRAIDYFERSIKIDPDYPIALNNLGHAWSKKGKPEKALPYFLQAVEKLPTYINALNNLGSTFIDLNRPTEAIPYLQRAIDADPEYSRSYFLMSMVYVKIKDYVTAIEYLNKYLKDNPKDPDALNNLGKCYFGLGRYQEAIKIYQQALKITPENFIVLNNLGNAYNKTGYHRKAMDCYEQALKIDPNYKPARYNLNLTIRREQDSIRTTQ
jgi:tetratricopeptide (TPR) repeat protein